MSFAQHDYRTAYLEDVLMCGDDPSDPQGCNGPHHRVWVYPANGSHASYPTTYHNACFQANSLPERDHEGEVLWGRNSRARSWRCARSYLQRTAHGATPGGQAGPTARKMGRQREQANGVRPSQPAPLSEYLRRSYADRLHSAAGASRDKAV